MASEDSERPPTPVFGSEIHTISSRADTTITVQDVKNSNGERHSVKFRVESASLKFVSSYFRSSLRFNNQHGHELVLKDDDPGALRVWFIYIHAVVKGKENDGEPKVTEEDSKKLFKSAGVKNTGIARIWNIINAGDKYLLNGTILEGFFGLWYAKNVDLSGSRIDEDFQDFVRQLALPCYMFNHRKGFAAVTKWLVYNIPGQITEKRPPGFKWEHMHLCGPDFERPMNHARGSLKTTLHKGIWESVGRILKEGPSKCECGHWDAVSGRYFAELVRLDAYPLEILFPKTSINTILSRLEDFNGVDLKCCKVCSVSWQYRVNRARQTTSKSFDGVCIDCMINSRNSRDNPDRFYWKCLGNSGGRWDKHCSIEHGQQTWYVSWCGRDEHRRKLLEEHYRERDG